MPYLLSEYRVETLAPPYMEGERPKLAEIPDRIDYGEPFQVSVELPAGTKLEDMKSECALLEQYFVHRLILPAILQSPLSIWAS